MSLFALGLFFAIGLRGDSRTHANAEGGLHSLSSPPPIVLWAWEEPEDLRSADPQSIGVAFLAERLFVGKDVTAVPRHQRILVPDSIWAEAVVRVEADNNFRDSEANRLATADDVLRVARLPGIRGVEVDFDATPPQRSFYTEVLRKVRRALPPAERLEITALVSWCSQPQGWLRTLPVDNAVPMYFRLGDHVGFWTVREPLCANAVGISTDEPEIQVSALASTSPDHRTIYLFSPRPWTVDQLAGLNQGHIPRDTRGAR